MEIEEDAKNPSGLSEFFGALSKEKDDVRQKIKEKINDPKSGLSSLFQQLEEALQETKKVSVEEVSDNTGRPPGTGLSPDDQNKLEVFSNLLNTLGSDKEIPVIVEPTDFVEELESEEIIHEEFIDETEKIAAFKELFKKFSEPTPKPKPEPIIKTIPVKEEKVPEIYSRAITDPVELLVPKVAERTGDIIQDIVSTLDDLNNKTQVKEEVDKISSIRKEFDNFRSLIAQQIASLQMSGAGSGETQLKFLDDVSTTGQENGDVLTYNATTKKYELKSSTSTVSSGQLLEETDGDNIVFSATDASGSDEDDDILLEAGVNSSRDFDFTVLQELTSYIIPQEGVKINLGSPTNRFQNLYLSAETIDLDGATIKSDGTGAITISADGVTLPTGSKDADGFILARTTAASEGAQIFKHVNLYTQASGLTTAAVSFKFNGRKANTAVYTEAGHVFTLSNGDARSDSTSDLFQF